MNTDRLVDVIADMIVEEIKGGPGSGIRGHHTDREESKFDYRSDGRMGLEISKSVGPTGRKYIKTGMDAIKAKGLDITDKQVLYVNQGATGHPGADATFTQGMVRRVHGTDEMKQFDPTIHLDSRVSGKADTFVHEYGHFVDWYLGGRKGDIVQVDGKNKIQTNYWSDQTFAKLKDPGDSKSIKEHAAEMFTVFINTGTSKGYNIGGMSKDDLASLHDHFDSAMKNLSSGKKSLSPITKASPLPKKINKQRQEEEFRKATRKLEAEFQSILIDYLSQQKKDVLASLRIHKSIGLESILKGGTGSGNYGHSGRSGKVGGSGEGGPGSGNYNGPGDPRFAHEEANGQKGNYDKAAGKIVAPERLFYKTSDAQKIIGSGEIKTSKAYGGVSLSTNSKLEAHGDQQIEFKKSGWFDKAVPVLYLEGHEREGASRLSPFKSYKDQFGNIFTKAEVDSIPMKMLDGHVGPIKGNNMFVNEEEWKFSGAIKFNKEDVVGVRNTKSFSQSITKASPGALSDRFDFSGWSFDKELWDKLLQERGGEFIKEMYDAEGTRAYDGLKYYIEDLAGGFNIDDPLVQEFLDNYTFTFAQNINATTEELLRQAMKSGMEAGLGMDGIAAKIEGLYDTWSDWRSLLIARTETIRASNMAANMAYRQSGVVEGKEWLVTLDDRLCDFCLPMNGKIIDLDKNFFDKGDSTVVGEGDNAVSMKLDYEDVGSPPLHCNCRCAIIPVILDSYGEGKSLPEEIGLQKVVKGGPGSGNYNGPGDPRYAAEGSGKPVEHKPVRMTMEEALANKTVFWHGSASGDLRGGPHGLHLGTYEAARQALEATIGIPKEGSWDGTREYGKTLLAGQDSINSGKYGEYRLTGYNVDAPREDHYPDGKATYSNREKIPMDVKPSINPYGIVGEMTNSRSTPHDDSKANSMMRSQLARGSAKRGYFYTNIGEDAGSISVVVPSKDHIRPIEIVKEKAIGLQSITKGGVGSGIRGHRTIRDTIASMSPKQRAASLARLQQRQKIDISKYSSNAKEITPEQRMAQADYKDIAAQMKSNLAKIQGDKPAYQKVDGDLSKDNTSSIRSNMNQELLSYGKYLAGDTALRARDYIDGFNKAIHQGATDGSLKGIKAEDINKLGIDSVQKLIHQEVESNRQAFIDHGIRHIEGDVSRAVKIAEAMNPNLTGKEALMINFALVNHDVGYTVPLIRAGGLRGVMITKDHPAFSEKIAKQQEGQWNKDKIFSKDEYGKITDAIRTHDSTDIKGSDFLTSIRTSDNLSLFNEEKLPSMFKYVKNGDRTLVEMGIAAKKDDKAEFSKLQTKLYDQIDKEDINANLKRDLKAATKEITYMTPKFTLGVLAGHISSIKKTDKGVGITVKYNDRDAQLQKLFDMGQKQTKKFLNDYGITDFSKTTYDIGGKIQLNVEGYTGSGIGAGKLPKRIGLGVVVKGGPGSGNFGHAGRRGEVGGSGEGDGGSKITSEESAVFASRANVLADKLEGYVQQYKKDGNDKFADQAVIVASHLRNGDYQSAYDKLAEGDLRYDIPNTSHSVMDLRDDHYIAKTAGSDWGTKPGEYTAWRSGSIEMTPRGIFFSADQSGASAYASGHEDAEPIAYKVSVKNPYSAKNMIEAYAHFTKQTVEEVIRRRDNNRHLDIGDWWLKADALIFRKAKKSGYDTVIYTKPAPPALREMVVLDSSSILESKKKSVGIGISTSFRGGVSESKGRTLGLQSILKYGTATSGNHDHSGRPGAVGGSGAGGSVFGDGILNLTSEQVKANNAAVERMNKDIFWREVDYSEESKNAPGISSYGMDVLKANKIFVQDQITDKIRDLPAFNVGPQDPKVREEQGLPPKEDSQRAMVNGYVKNNINQWAVTSGDSISEAVATQLLISKIFNLGDVSISHYSTIALDNAKQRVEDELWSSTKAAFLQAQYDATQKYFKDAGIKEVIAYRGVHHSDDGKMRDETVQLQPLSSFSVNPKTALNFANIPNPAGGKSDVVRSGTIYAARVPVEKILSHPRTGFGCTGEGEVTVLGGKMTSTVIPTKIANEVYQIAKQLDSNNVSFGRTSTFNENFLDALSRVTPAFRKEIGLSSILKIGTATSGNHGHSGRPGQVGGSGDGDIAGGETLISAASGRDVLKRANDLDQATHDLKNSIGADSVGNKLSVQNLLYERLKDNEDLLNFGDLLLERTEYNFENYDPKDAQEAAIRSLVDTWAGTSGDTNPDAIAIQMAVEKEFGIKDAYIPHRQHESGGTDTSEITFGIAKETFDKNEKGLRAFVRAQYEETQQYLKDKEIKELILFRGVGKSGIQGLSENQQEKGINDMDIKMMPISSFSLSLEVSNSFAKSDGAVLVAIVPRERIFSTPRTGVGCTGEGEITVLGGKMTVTSLNVLPKGNYAIPLSESDSWSLMRNTRYLIKEKFFGLSNILKKVLK